MIDLHCHSNCSDGTDSPDVLAGLADLVGLKAVALTDHDTLAGLDCFLGQQHCVSAHLIAGIELSCVFSGQELHVLGLFIEHGDPIFQQRVDSLGKRRQRRNAKILEKLRHFDISICPDAYFEAEQGILTRAHIAEMLINEGHADTKAEVFHKYLGEGGLAYVPFEHLSPETAFSWIKEAGGTSVIAHPARFGRFARSQFIWDRAMEDLRDMGAQGIEAYYSEHSQAETAYFLGLCNTLGMAPSGGSDYHGRVKPGCQLGLGWGNLDVPDEVLGGLLELKTQKITGTQHCLI